MKWRVKVAFEYEAEVEADTEAEAEDEALQEFTWPDAASFSVEVVLAQ